MLHIYRESQVWQELCFHKIKIYGTSGLRMGIINLFIGNENHDTIDWL